MEGCDFRERWITCVLNAAPRSCIYTPPNPRRLLKIGLGFGSPTCPPSNPILEPSRYPDSRLVGSTQLGRTLAKNKSSQLPREPMRRAKCKVRLHAPLANTANLASHVHGPARRACGVYPTSLAHQRL